VSEDLIDILVFELAGRRYGLAARAVRELHRAVAVTPLPNAPAVVEGVIDVHGAIVPVYDLRARFGLPRCAVDPSHHLIVAFAGGRTVALRVDRAHELVREALREAPFGGGVATLRDGLVVVHDLDRFLSDAEATALDRALEAT
jgi:purine-binding chemotaxis protein CheW